MLYDDSEDEEGAGRAGGRQGVPNLMQMEEETAPGKGWEALSPSHPPGSSCQPTGQSTCSSPISASLLYVGTLGLFHLQGTKLDLGKQFWICLGLESTGSPA